MVKKSFGHQSKIFLTSSRKTISAQNVPLVNCYLSAENGEIPWIKIITDDGLNSVVIFMGYFKSIFDFKAFFGL